MLTAIHPKLPMRDKEITKDFYLNKLGFTLKSDYGDYLLLEKDAIEIHFFLFEEIDPKENYGMVYLRCDNAKEWYELAIAAKLDVPKAGHLKAKPWGILEFALRDPDMNLLTFGEMIA